MEAKERITFEIAGDDFKKVEMFRKQHEGCAQGMTGERFTYSFIPTGLGLFSYVKCSCGQTMTIGDFMDQKSVEYDSYENRVLTEADHLNQRFEEAVLRILQMKSPRVYRICFGKDQSFDMIYAISAYGIAFIGEERVSKCILWQNRRGERGEMIDNYEGLDEKEKIEAFYQYFEEHVRREISKYDCRNKKLLKALHVSNANDG